MDATHEPSHLSGHAYGRRLSELGAPALVALE